MQRMPRHRAHGGVRHKQSGAEPAEHERTETKHTFADEFQDANQFHIFSFLVSFFASIVKGRVGHLRGDPQKSLKYFFGVFWRFFVDFWQHGLRWQREAATPLWLRRAIRQYYERRVIRVVNRKRYRRFALPPQSKTA